MTTKTVEAVKREIGARWIGKAGIHGVGLDARNEILVYHDGDSDLISAQVEPALTQEAAPFSVRFVPTPRATAV